VCGEYKAAKDKLIAARNDPKIQSHKVVEVAMKVNKTMERHKSFSEKFGIGQTSWVRERMKYDDECASILKQIQLLEQQRIETLKDCLTRWVVFETSLTANRKYDVKGLATALENVDISKDQSRLITNLLSKHPPPSDPRPLSVNDRLLVLSPSEQWRETKIVEVDTDSYLIHYIGFASKWNERILKTSPRIKHPSLLVNKSRKNLICPTLDFEDSEPVGFSQLEKIENVEPSPPAHNTMGKWLKSILNRKNRATQTSNCQHLEIKGAGSSVVNGLYMERATIEGEIKN